MKYYDLVVGLAHRHWNTERTDETLLVTIHTWYREINVIFLDDYKEFFFISHGRKYRFVTKVVWDNKITRSVSMIFSLNTVDHLMQEQIRNFLQTNPSFLEDYVLHHVNEDQVERWLSILRVQKTSKLVVRSPKQIQRVPSINAKSPTENGQ